MEDTIANKYEKAVSELNDELIENCNNWYNYVLNLPKDQQVVYTVVLLNWLVENGGFHQYFFNSCGQFAYLTIRNLKLIKANERAELLDTATHLVNEEYFNEDTFRHLIFNRELQKIVDFDEILFTKLSKLDDKYCDMEEEDLYDLLESYLNVQS